MSSWNEHQLERRIVEVLRDVPVRNPGGHHFGRAYITAYQLAVEVDHRWPEIREALGYPLGGEGSGQQMTFARYLAKELSTRISREGPAYPVEGAFLGHLHLLDLVVARPDGEDPIRASFFGRNQDLSMYRSRPEFGAEHR
ncbi:hypothetical protein ACE2AJ_00320 [Aquihabitans daechungensis]|uniref:hypothetical protein n=1 Tax=Aquihabitans daechungensis TaxID=1052257 RepID=UPI003B9EA279